MADNLLIFGDSYSTYKGCIPEGYAYYYSEEGTDPEHPIRKMRKEETWWHRYITKSADNLILNNSWSGSTVCYTGYNGDCSQSSSFIYRYRTLKREGFFDKNRIDTVIVLGATNDSWCNAPLGEITFGSESESDLKSVIPAISHFMRVMREDLPEAKIVYAINSDVIKPEISDAIEKLGARFGFDTVRLDGIDKLDGHPTVKGMSEICDRIYSFIKG